MIVYQGKLSFQNWSGIKTLPNKQKVSESFASRHSLQDKRKEMLWADRKWQHGNEYIGRNEEYWEGLIGKM